MRAGKTWLGIFLSVVGALLVLIGNVMVDYVEVVYEPSIKSFLYTHPYVLPGTCMRILGVASLFVGIFLVVGALRKIRSRGL